MPSDQSRRAKKPGKQRAAEMANPAAPLEFRLPMIGKRDDRTDRCKSPTSTNLQSSYEFRSL
jgi:hypothetical protein